MGFGVSFMPGRGGGGNGSGAGAPRPGPQLQEAIKILSLRLPRVVGGAPSAPGALLSGPGSGGSAFPNSALGQTQGLAPGALGALPMAQPRAGMMGPSVGGASGGAAAPSNPIATILEQLMRGGSSPAPTPRFDFSGPPVGGGPPGAGGGVGADGSATPGAAAPGLSYGRDNFSREVGSQPSREGTANLNVGPGAPVAATPEIFQPPPTSDSWLNQTVTGPATQAPSVTPSGAGPALSYGPDARVGSVPQPPPASDSWLNPPGGSVDATLMNGPNDPRVQALLKTFEAHQAARQAAQQPAVRKNIWTRQ